MAAAQPIHNALELGTYCGYSAVRIARLLPPGVKLVALDPAEVPERVAGAILEHAGVCKQKVAWGVGPEGGMGVSAEEGCLRGGPRAWAAPGCLPGCC